MLKFLHLQKLIIFFSKNTCELDIVLTRTVYILTTNELVKLTMLWTTGPKVLYVNSVFCWHLRIDKHDKNKIQF